MRKLPSRFTSLSIVILLALVGCQDVQPSQQVNSSVNQAKVASVLDKYETGSSEYTEPYANLSVEEMKAFLDLEHQRVMERFEALEQNPFEERDVLLNSSGQVFKDDDEQYSEQFGDPGARIERRRVRLTEQELLQRRAELDHHYRWRLKAHQLSVARYGVSFNALDGKQFDSVIEDAEAQMNDLSTQQSCTYNPNVYPRSGTVPYVGVSALARTMRYIGTISDGGCDPFYAISGSSSVTRLSQNPSSSQRCISNLANAPVGAVRSYARRRAAQESASRFIIGPGTRIRFVCANNISNWALSARAN